MKEITSDLIENHPKSYALNCGIKLQNLPPKLNVAELNTFFLDSIEYEFEVKCLQRNSRNKYNDTGVYEVELYECNSKKTFLDFYLAQSDFSLNESDTTVVSSIQEVTSNDVTADDKAIADNYAHNKIDNTSFLNANETGNTLDRSNFDFSSMPSDSIIEPSRDFTKTPPRLKQDSKFAMIKISDISSNSISDQTRDWTKTPPSSKEIPRFSMDKISDMSANSFDNILNLNLKPTENQPSKQSALSDGTKAQTLLKEDATLPVDRISNLSASSLDKQSGKQFLYQWATSEFNKTAPCCLNNVSFTESQPNKQFQESWSTTPPHMKNFNGHENTLNVTNLNETTFNTKSTELKNNNVSLDKANSTSGEKSVSVDPTFNASMPNLNDESLRDKNDESTHNETESTITEDSTYFDTQTDSRAFDHLEKSVVPCENNEDIYKTAHGHDESTLNNSNQVKFISYNVGPEIGIRPIFDIRIRLRISKFKNPNIYYFRNSNKNI